MRVTLSWLVIGAALSAVPAVSEAQYRAQGFESWRLASDEAADLRLSSTRPPNYGLVGGLVGGAVGAILGGFGGHALCMNYSSSSQSDACTGGIVAGALIGGAILGLVGYGFARNIERHPTPPQPDAAETGNAIAQQIIQSASVMPASYPR